MLMQLDPTEDHDSFDDIRREVRASNLRDARLLIESWKKRLLKQARKELGPGATDYQCEQHLTSHAMWRDLFLMAFDEFGRDIARDIGLPDGADFRFDAGPDADQLFDFLIYLVEQGSDPFAEIDRRCGVSAEGRQAVARADIEGAQVHPLLVRSAPAGRLRQVLRAMGARFLSPQSGDGFSPLVRRAVVGDFTVPFHELMALRPSAHEIKIAFWVLLEAAQHFDPDIDESGVREWLGSLATALVLLRSDRQADEALSELRFAWLFEGLVDIAYGRSDAMERREALAGAAFRWGQLLGNPEHLRRVLELAVGLRDFGDASLSVSLQVRLKRLLREAEPPFGAGEWDRLCEAGHVTDTPKRRLRILLRVVLGKHEGRAADFATALRNAVEGMPSGRDRLKMLAALALFVYRAGENAAMLEDVLQQLRDGEFSADERSAFLSMLVNVELDSLIPTAEDPAEGLIPDARYPLDLLRQAGAQASIERLESVARMLDRRGGMRGRQVVDWLETLQLRQRNDRIAEILRLDDEAALERHLSKTFLREFDGDQLGALDQLRQSLRLDPEKNRRCWEAMLGWVDSEYANLDFMGEFKKIDQHASNAGVGDAAAMLKALLAEAGTQRFVGRFGRPRLHVLIERFLHRDVPLQTREWRKRVFREVCSPVSMGAWLSSDLLAMRDVLGRTTLFIIAGTGNGPVMQRIRHQIQGVNATRHCVRTQAGVSPLMAAAAVATNGDVDALLMLDELLSIDGSQLDEAASRGRSPHGIRAVHVAYRYGNFEAAERLVRRGASVHLKQGDSTSVILEAIRSRSRAALRHAREQFGSDDVALRLAAQHRISDYLDAPLPKLGELPVPPTAHEATALSLAVAADSTEMLADVSALLGVDNVRQQITGDVVDILVRFGDPARIDALVGGVATREAVLERLRGISSPPILDRVLIELARSRPEAAISMFRYLVLRCDADRPSQAAQDSIRGRRSLLSRLVALWGVGGEAGKVARTIAKEFLTPMRLNASPDAKAYVKRMLAERDEEFQDFPIGLANRLGAYDCAMKLAGILDADERATRLFAASVFQRLRAGAADALPVGLRRRGGPQVLALVEDPAQPGALRVKVTLNGHDELIFPSAMLGVPQRERHDANAENRIVLWLQDSANERALDDHGLTMSGFCNWLWWTAMHPAF